MADRVFINGEKKYVIENFNDKIYTLKCYENDEEVGSKEYAKECYAISALRNKNGGELPEEVIGQTTDHEVIDLQPNELSIRKPKLEDVITREDYSNNLLLCYWFEFDKERYFTLPGYPDIKYIRENQDYFLLKKEKVEKRYRVNVVEDYNHFVREFLYPEVDFDLSFEDLFDKEHVQNLKEKVSNVGNSYLDLAFYLYKFKQVRVSKFSSDDKFVYDHEYISIYDFAEKHLGFCKTTTKNMLAIVEKFADKDVLKLQDGYEKYSYSQLTELCSVDDDDLFEFNSDMTIKEIRQKKKELKDDEPKVVVEDTSTVVRIPGNLFNNQPARLVSFNNFPSKDEIHDELVKFIEREFWDAKRIYFPLEKSKSNNASLFEFVTACISFIKELCVSFNGTKGNPFDFSGFNRAVESLRRYGYIKDRELNENIQETEEKEE